MVGDPLQAADKVEYAASREKAGVIHRPSLPKSLYRGAEAGAALQPALLWIAWEQRRLKRVIASPSWTIRG